MSKNNFPRIFLNKKEEDEIKQGFPWVFDNEISSIKHRDNPTDEWKNESLDKTSLKDGSAVEVYTNAGGFLATGIFNKSSKITVRIIGFEHADKIYENINLYWENIVRSALELRLTHFAPNDSYRLIFAEADFVPGFICERFCTEDNKVYLVVQFLSLSCEVFRKELLSALVKLCSPDGIYERSDASVREKEGLPLRAGWIDLSSEDFNEYKDAAESENQDSIIIVENGIRLCVDIANGQKTGYFLDQKFNRREIAKYCKGKAVLDTFTHTGAFGLNAFKAGADSVISVDISPEAVEIVNKNIKLNGADKKMTAVCADVFDLLKKYESEEKKFDLIILDPPAFTKSAKMIEKAYGGYKEINLRAMRLLNKGGILVTCSCSYFMEANMFCDMIMHAAVDSHKRVQILEKRGAGPDHPLLLGYPKSEYLKCVICRVD